MKMLSVLRMCTSQEKTYKCIMLKVKIDSQFPLSPKPNSSMINIKAGTQRKLRINLS